MGGQHVLNRFVLKTMKLYEHVLFGTYCDVCLDCLNKMGKTKKKKEEKNQHISLSKVVQKMWYLLCCRDLAALIAVFNAADNSAIVHI